MCDVVPYWYTTQMYSSTSRAGDGVKVAWQTRVAGGAWWIAGGGLAIVFLLWGYGKH